MKVGEKRWKVLYGKLQQIEIDRISGDMTYYHYIKEGTECWAETKMVEATTFETAEDALNYRLNTLERQRKNVEDEIYRTRQMLSEYLEF